MTPAQTSALFLALVKLDKSVDDLCADSNVPVGATREKVKEARDLLRFALDV